MQTIALLRNFSLCALCALACTATAADVAAKPYVPGWKYTRNNIEIEVTADGTTTTKYDNAYTLLAESELHSLSEQTITYHEHDGKLEDVVAYTLKPDGKRIDVPERNVQVTSRDGINGAPPAFSDFMSRHLVYPDVAVGDTIVLSYILRDVKPSFRNYFSLLSGYSQSSVYDEASLTVTAPASMKLKHKTYNLPQPVITHVGKGQQRWQWTYHNPVALDQRKESSLFERAWHLRELPTIEVSNFSDYKQIAAAYEAEAAPRAQPSERVRALGMQIVGDATNRREQTERIYRWVAKEITFAGNCLTGGDVVPRTTDVILDLKMGDCKDHATLLQALLAARDIKSTQVLVNARELGYEVPDVPCWQAFNHVFNYVPEFDVYLDSTSSSTPYGALPDSDRGKPVVHTAAYNGIRHTPTRALADNSTDADDTMTVNADGSIAATGKYKLVGDLAHSYSEHFRQWKQSPEFDGGEDYMRRAIEGFGYKGSGGYEDFPETTGPADTFAYAIHYDVHEFYDTSDPHGITLTPFFPTPNPIQGLMQYAAADSYDHDFLCSGDQRSERLKIALPDNVHLLAVPHDVHASTALMDFEAIYTRLGNTITVQRKVVDRSPGPICTPDVAAQYARIAAAIKKDQKAQAVYEPISGTRP